MYCADVGKKFERMHFCRHELFRWRLILTGTNPSHERIKKSMYENLNFRSSSRKIEPKYHHHVEYVWTTYQTFESCGKIIIAHPVVGVERAPSLCPRHCDADIARSLALQR